MVNSMQPFRSLQNSEIFVYNHLLYKKIPEIKIDGRIYNSFCLDNRKYDYFENSNVKKGDKQ